MWERKKDPLITDLKMDSEKQRNRETYILWLNGACEATEMETPAAHGQHGENEKRRSGKKWAKMAKVGQKEAKVERKVGP